MMSKDEWNKNKTKQLYEPAELIVDGFIHFSFKNQLVSVANAIYKEHLELIILEVDSKKLMDGTCLKVEDLYNYGGKYPHLYSALNTSAVVSEFKMKQLNNEFQLIL